MVFLMVCFYFLQRSREVINTGAIPNTKIQAINRGLKRKRKLGKLFLHMCLAFFSHVFTFMIWGCGMEF